MKTILNDLSDDLIGEILSRVPITSLSVLRSTCKRWNDLSKTHVFGGKKAAENQQFLGFMLIGYKICSLRFSFQGITNEDKIFVDPSVKKIKIHELEEDVVVTQVYQYDGLLLCVTNYHSCLVWNPYLGQTRWIKPPRNTFGITNSYALGYDNNRNHKILRFFYDLEKALLNSHALGYDVLVDLEKREYQIEVYNFSSNEWRSTVLDHVNTDSEEPDYNTKRFGTPLPLPLPSKSLSPNYNDSVTLSCLRDEKLVLLYNKTLERIKIWISTKIEPNEISWTMFFKLDSNHLPHDFPYYFGGIKFLIDADKKLALLFRINTSNKSERRCCIIGEDRFINYINLGDALNNHWNYTNRVCSRI